METLDVTKESFVRKEYVMSRYVYMLTDIPSDEPPKLYGSRKRALAELERLFKETLEEAIFLKPKDKAELETAFRENKTWFTIIDAPPEERNPALARAHKIVFIRTCSVTKEWVR